MRVIGLDQSYTGFGYCVDGDSKKKGFPASKFESDLKRLVAVREWLYDLFEDAAPVDLVVMEGYANAAKFGREIAGELGGTVKLAVYEMYDQEPLIVPPTSLKKFVTGKGNAKKNEMLLGVYKQWGVSYADDNQADAYALEQFGHCYLWVGGHTEPRGMERSWTQYQTEAVEKVRALVE